MPCQRTRDRRILRPQVIDAAAIGGLDQARLGFAGTVEVSCASAATSLWFGKTRYTG